MWVQSYLGIGQREGSAARRDRRRLQPGCLKLSLERRDHGHVLRPLLLQAVDLPGIIAGLASVQGDLSLSLR